MTSITRTTFRLDEFLPPDCACRIEDRIVGLDGIEDVIVQPVHGQVTVEYDGERLSKAEVLERLAAAGCPCEEEPVSQTHLTHDAGAAGEHVHHGAQVGHAATAAPEEIAGHVAAPPDEHAGHAAAAPDEHAGHVAAAPDEHAGHVAAAPDEHAEPEEHAEHHDHHAMMQADLKRRFLVSAVVTIPLLLLSPTIQDWFSIDIPAFSGDRYVLFLLATVLVGYGAWPFFKGAARAIPTGVMDMDVLISVAVASGYLFSVAATFWFEAIDFYWEIGTLVDVLLFGHWMEMRAIRGTTDALKELGKFAPDMANLMREGEVVEVPTGELQEGDTVLVRPGERVPIDGDVAEGESEIDESMITGESRPVAKAPGAPVIGGSINGAGALYIQVTRTGEETTISQMAKLVTEAQASKPAVQRLADRAAHWLTIIAIVVGVGTLMFWYFVADEPFVAALTLAITVVVIACPHALGLAIPMVTTISTTLAARNGMLVKSAQAMEVARQIDVVVFDKTGTLTRGEFGVTGIVAVGGWTEDQVLERAAAVEATSEHPIARGILRSAQERGLTYDPAANFQAIPGKGAQAEVAGEIVYAGTPRLMEQVGVTVDGVSDEVERIAEGGNTLVYLAHDGKLRGVLALADIVREESREAVNALRAMGIEPAMLTGDNKGIAAAVGRELGLDTVIAEVLPGDKADKVRELQRGGRRVAMVGDGVNDAPALTQADVGIAIGAGTDVAIESADVVLMRSDPRDVVKMVQLSRATVTKMRQNLAWATGYNVFAIPLAAGVAVPAGIMLRPEWGALLMAARRIIVALNALLLRRADLSGPRPLS